MALQPENSRRKIYTAILASRTPATLLEKPKDRLRLCRTGAVCQQGAFAQRRQALTDGVSALGEVRLALLLLLGNAGGLMLQSDTHISVGPATGAEVASV